MIYLYVKQHTITGKSWYNNGVISKAFKVEEIPEGYIKGRIIKNVRTYI